MKACVITWSCLLAGVLASHAQDGAKAELLKAVRQMTQEPSYAWVSSSASAEGTHDWKQGPTYGKSEKDGLTYVTFALGESQVEMVFLQGKSAIKWADRWRNQTELKDDLSWIGERLKSYKFGAEEATFLAEHTQELTSEADREYEGQLDAEALRFLLSRGRREVNDTSNIHGTVHFWVKDGHVEKYRHNIKGPVPYGQDGALVNFDRTTIVEFHDIGSTQVAPPPEGAEKVR